LAWLDSRINDVTVIACFALEKVDAMLRLQMGVKFRASTFVAIFIVTFRRHSIYCPNCFINLSQIMYPQPFAVFV
jgi:hypothetical protein